MNSGFSLKSLLDDEDIYSYECRKEGEVMDDSSMMSVGDDTLVFAT